MSRMTTRRDAPPGILIRTREGGLGFAIGLMKENKKFEDHWNDLYLCQANVAQSKEAYTYAKNVGKVTLTNK